jgi:NtrC-family two-component system sensor histidine kinase KinB
MKLWDRHNLPLLTSVMVFGALVWLTVNSPPSEDLLIPSVLFLLLVVFTSTFSAPLGGGMASLTPMTIVAGYLVVGLIPAAWIAFLGLLLHGILRRVFGRHLGLQKDLYLLTTIRLTSANISSKTTSILVAGIVYQAAGGEVPLSAIYYSSLLPLLLLGLVYYGLNDLIYGSFIATWEARSFHLKGRSMYSSILYEGGPIVFSPLIAMIYASIGLMFFYLVIVAVIASTLITRSLSFALIKLERQLMELRSLQAVGQALSSSLEMEDILAAIYEQVTHLMPAESFYIALYEEETGKVSFPLAVESEIKVHKPSRRGGRGLTELVLQTRAPLLSRESTDVIRSKRGLDQANRPATSWLGVPIIAGDSLMGVISVHSYSVYDLYDETHQEILMTIAAQAGVALQNARLYARTDEALSRRVQELDSILRTVEEGILLIDLSYRVVAVNRALAKILGISRSNMVGTSLFEPGENSEPVLINRIGYTLEELKLACQEIIDEEVDFKRKIISLEERNQRYIEQTITPVRGSKRNISAWLLVFRDVTEEMELDLLREDMMHTLVHDLRSPLAVLKGSLEVVNLAIEEGNSGNLDKLLGLSQVSTDRMLRLVNNLLDVSRLEEGRLILHRSRIEVKVLLSNAVEQIAPAASRAGIKIDLFIEDELPPVYIDVDYMERVLNNLLDNAIKFTPDGGVIDVWARMDNDAQPSSLLIGIRDTGPGISEKVQEQLFTKYQQSDSVKGRRAGSGLGLHYCKLAVDAHGGEIWVESVQGEGSTFIVRLPMPQE